MGWLVDRSVAVGPVIIHRTHARIHAHICTLSNLPTSTTTTTHRPAHTHTHPTRTHALTLDSEVQDVGCQDHELKGQEGGVDAVGISTRAGLAPRGQGRDGLVHGGADEVGEAGERGRELGDGGDDGVDRTVEQLAQEGVARDAEGVGEEVGVVHPQVSGFEPEAHEDEHDAAEGRGAVYMVSVGGWVGDLGWVGFSGRW
jgi:hypothetical protein